MYQTETRTLSQILTSITSCQYSFLSREAIWPILKKACTHQQFSNLKGGIVPLLEIHMS